MKREAWADVSKCIAIFLMVWAHIGIENDIKCFIHVFHMPFFFFVSGYFEKVQSISFRNKLLKNIKNIMVPYFFFSLFAFSYCWVYPYRHPELYPGVDNVQDFFIAALKGMFIMDDSVSYCYFMPNFALWFLAALFIDKLLFGLLSKIFVDDKFQILKWGGIIGLSLLTFSQLSSVTYYSVDSAIMGFSLYVTGFLFNQYKLIYYINSRTWIIVCLFILSILYVSLIAPQNGIVSIDGGVYGSSIFLFYFNAIIGILMLISCSSLIIKFCKNINIIHFWGKNTLIILGIHVFLILIFKFLFMLLAISLVYYTTFIMAILVLLFSTPIIHIILNKIPFLVGKS